LRTTSTRRTMPKTNTGASALAPLHDGSSTGELIAELVRHGLAAGRAGDRRRARRQSPRANRVAARLPQRQPAPHPDNPGGRHPAHDPQTPLCNFFPVGPRAQASHRSDAFRDDHGDLGQGHLDAQGRRPGSHDRLAGGHLAFRGQSHLPGARCTGPAVPGAPA
jgi:hypothetical protein